MGRKYIKHIRGVQQNREKNAKNENKKLIRQSNYSAHKKNRSVWVKNNLSQNGQK